MKQERANDWLPQIAHKRLSRRDLLRGAVLGVVGLTAATCGEGRSGTAGSGVAGNGSIDKNPYATLALRYFKEDVLPYAYGIKGPVSDVRVEKIEKLQVSVTSDFEAQWCVSVLYQDSTSETRRVFINVLKHRDEERPRVFSYGNIPASASDKCVNFK